MSSRPLRPSTRAGASAASTNENSDLAAPRGKNAVKTTAPLTRRRAALGDVSNFNKDANAAKPKDAATDSKLPTRTARLETRRALGPAITTNAALPRNRPSRTGTTAERSTVAVLADRARPGVAPRASTSTTTTSSTGLSRRVPAASSSHTAQVKRTHSIEVVDPAAKRARLNRAKSRDPEPAAQAPAEAPAEVPAEAPAVVAPESTPAEDVVVRSPVARSAQDWDDLDAEDHDDPLMVSEYVVEIFDFMYNVQRSYLPDPQYMSRQTHFNWAMRGVLVDWLVEVHCKFRLLPETLFLAVNIADRYFSICDTDIDKIQLVGLSALFVAAKYEEVFTPAIHNFAYTAEGYREDEILEKEREILRVLEFKLSYPNPMNFLRRISKADDYDIQTRTIGKYLLEISLLDHRLLQYTPSQHSAAAMLLARRMLERSPHWHPNLVHYSGGCDEASLQPIIALIVDYLVAPVAHESFFKKYASKRFLKASILSRSWAREHRDLYPLEQ